jgi:serine/threonine protein kinase
MEFCANRTLRSLIDQRKDNEWIDEDLVWTLFRQMLEGLNHIHMQGCVRCGAGAAVAVLTRAPLLHAARSIVT